MTAPYPSNGKVIPLKDNYPAKSLSVLAKQVGSHGETALHIAAQKGKAGPVEKLLAHGADAGATRKGNKLTPLHIAIRKEHSDVALMLVEHLRKSGNVNALNVISVDGYSPFQLAAKHGLEKVVDALIDAGVDIELSARKGASKNHAKVSNWTGKWLSSMYSPKKQTPDVTDHADCDQVVTNSMRAGQ